MTRPPFVEPPTPADVAKAKRARRAELDKARAHGLRQRHAAKLARTRTTFSSETEQCSRCRFTIPGWTVHYEIGGHKVCRDCLWPGELDETTES